MRQVLLGLLALSVVSTELPGQVVVRDPPKCPLCRVTLEPVVTLGEREGSGALPGDPVTVATDSRGFFYVLTFAERDRVLAFDRNGSFTRSLGRSGQGPGEYQNIQHIEVVTGDSLYVYDGGNARLTVLTPSWEDARAEVLPGGIHRGIRLDDGALLINATVGTREAIGLPLHLLRDSPTPTRSFGSETALFRPGIPYLNWRSLALAGDTAVWTAPRTKYELELWRFDGARALTLVRETNWFRPYEVRQPISPENPGQPWLTGIHAAKSGEIFVAVIVPRADWKDRLGPPIQTAAGPRYRRDNPNLWETVIEVIDGTTGDLLVTDRVDAAIHGFIGSHLVYSYREDDSGFPFVDVWRLSITSSLQ